MLTDAGAVAETGGARLVDGARKTLFGRLLPGYVPAMDTVMRMLDRN